MKTSLSILFGLFFLCSCAQDKKAVADETAFQREINSDYKDASKSPLKEKDLKTFKGLDFFKFDSAYVVTARFIRTMDQQHFTIKTTNDSLPEYRKYGELTFTIIGGKYESKCDQTQDLLKKED